MGGSVVGLIAAIALTLQTGLFTESPFSFEFPWLLWSSVCVMSITVAVVGSWLPARGGWRARSGVGGAVYWWGRGRYPPERIDIAPPERIDIAPPERSVAKRSWGAVYWWGVCKQTLIRCSCDDPPCTFRINQTCRAE